jgi:thioredoxin reductase (NADPH)
MAKRIGENLERLGVVFKYKCTPISFTKQGEAITCEYENTETKVKEKGTYDTVLLAVGRVPDTTKLLGEKVKLKLAQSGKIAVDAAEKSSIDNIYSIGDCAEGRPELTPPAIMAGKLLARRLFGNQNTLMDYVNIPTTVFTPIEYGSCGLSEEAAKKQYGNNAVVYHKEFKPLEWEFDKNIEEACYMKIIVNKANKNKVIGFHIFSPNAGEVTQGIGVAMKIGVTKEQLDSAVGIHPTIAEEMTTMDTTKEMGDGKKSGC